MIHLVKKNIPERYYANVQEKPDVKSHILSQPKPWDYLTLRHVRDKNNLRGALLEDSGYVCIYCGIRVTRKASVIEHIMCRSVSKLRVLDDTIMGISCSGGGKQETVVIQHRQTIEDISDHWGITVDYLRSLNPTSSFNVGERIIVAKQESSGGFHCDKSKEDQLIHFHPLKRYCYFRLAYKVDDLNEEVEIFSPFNEERVIDAITKLNLNNNLLKSLRYSVIEDIEENIEKIVDLELPKEEEKLKIIELYMQYATLDSANQYAPYYFVGLYHLEEYYKRYN